MRLANITPAPVYPDRAQVLPDKMLTKTVFHVWAKMNSTLPGAALSTDQNLQVRRQGTAWAHTQPRYGCRSADMQAASCQPVPCQPVPTTCALIITNGLMESWLSV
jgi:hypothetical protein